jgi:hypothetical protein
MLVKDFYKMLASVRNKFYWYVAQDGTIRGEPKKHTKNQEGDGVCPLTAVCLVKAHKSYHVNNYENAAKALHLRLRDAERIVNGADDNEVRPYVRKKLLEILKPKNTQK